MSAYVVDPRTIDYLVQWAVFGSPGGRDASAYFPKGIPAEYQHAASAGYRLYLSRMVPAELGQLLIDENVRSVRARYSDCGADDLPGPIDQSRVWRYQFQPVDHQALKAAWVIKSCDCLDYQSCETSDWKDTLAYAVVQGIRESAISSLTEEAPWGVTDNDLQPKVRV